MPLSKTIKLIKKEIYWATVTETTSHFLPSTINEKNQTTANHQEILVHQEKKNKIPGTYKKKNIGPVKMKENEWHQIIFSHNGG